MKRMTKHFQNKFTEESVNEEIRDFELDEEVLGEEDDLELDEEVLGEEDDLELDEEVLGEEDDLELDEEVLGEEDDLGLDEGELEEEDDLELDEEELEEEDDLELDEGELEEEDDLELDEEELEEEDDLELDEEGLEEEDVPKPRSKKQKIKSFHKNEISAGLTVSPKAKNELDEQLEEFLSTKVKTFDIVGNKGSSYLSVVKADTGTSIRLTKDATAKLSNPTQLFVSFVGSYLVLCNGDGLNVPSYKGNFKSGRTTVYNTGLVDAIIKQFNLDFSNKTSISFSEGYYKQQGRAILYVKLG
ncbi:hypothetical protein M3568_18395 [Priestia flexa]|uniref:hypothetical protein n=1 Tax=Priestia flexa TaxID=86664 RepID=UPI00203D8FF8|nr:hypothetical protein [Priestia flexa]MCM3068294.1 hypothetical protein [Priestia flexa]